jgi:hypothetical protein
VHHLTVECDNLFSKEVFQQKKTSSENQIIHTLNDPSLLAVAKVNWLERQKGQLLLKN